MKVDFVVKHPPSSDLSRSLNWHATTSAHLQWPLMNLKKSGAEVRVSTRCLELNTTCRVGGSGIQFWNINRKHTESRVADRIGQVCTESFL
jgi:hypothetical protein